MYYTLNECIIHGTNIFYTEQMYWSLHQFYYGNTYIYKVRTFFFELKFSTVKLFFFIILYLYIEIYVICMVISLVILIDIKLELD